MTVARVFFTTFSGMIGYVQASRETIDGVLVIRKPPPDFFSTYTHSK